MTDDKQFKMLHTMIRVLDIEKSVDFYTRLLGMKLLRKKDFPGGRFTNVFVGYGSEDTHAVVELTHNWDQVEPYELGSGYGHIALGVKDIYKVCEDLERSGAKIPRKPGPMKHGTTHIAFIEDPDGYKIELVDLDTRKI
ncbi:lactoylglutathione lyase [Hyphomicrobiales bacterium]|jgi:lactoylglutathione lyase|nr:lactoylglutathione lyase [Rhodobiaceae bacterium]MBT6223334.1 lactoylglutathione lyase [Rhodobiaceae bacterium]MDB4831880.1 lactoylglutathione lyase [Hyphomicrobiales bacterium]MDC0139564.1 lactoylglutathione lyase [Hyphomicrobiales bacterium]MDC3272308.1 lactoylglutathione lyase [Hyphomicrobiales bacterium]|tara:strand:+ start:138 stop:554 length:417 start_codon:yes stop_codon:yes gene_type:complete